jgi:hypothetical protein
MIPYIVYSALITAICFLFYRVLLHRETFFGLNRWFFIGCLLFSFGLPLVHIPAGWSLRTKDQEQMVSAAPAKVEKAVLKEIMAEPGPGEASPRVISSKRKKSAEFSPSKLVTKPSPLAAQTALTSFTTNSLLKSRSVSMNSPQGEQISKGFFYSLLKWLYYGYLFGVIAFGIILLTELLVLIYQIRCHPVTRDGIYWIVHTSGNRAPCSFGRYIFINPSLYDQETFEQILTHEKIHVRQRHSVDIVLAELCLVIQWFNPFAWFYRKALEDNLEFLTDAAIIGDPRTNASRYQMSLLRVSAPHLPLSITSNYNQSRLKKRMIMMHTEKSTSKTTWKYLFLLPLLTAMACLFNNATAVSQNLNPSKASQQGPAAPAPVSGKAQPSPVATPSAVSAMDAGSPRAVGVPDIDIHGMDFLAPVIASDLAPVQVNLSVNPVITTDIITTDIAAVQMADIVTSVNASVMPMASVVADVNLNFDNRTGTWMATVRRDTVELMLKCEEQNNYRGFSTYNETIPKKEFSSLPTSAKGDFSVVREAGTLSFNGVFDGDEGFGHYSFKENADLENYLVKKGVEGVTDNRMLDVFFGNVTRAYVDELEKAGYTQIPLHVLTGLSSMKVDVAYINSWKQLGYSDLQLRDVTGLKSMNIDGAYLKDLQNAGIKDIALRDLIGAKSVGIDGAYVQTWKQAGYVDLSLRDLISAKSVGIDPSYVQGWKQAGFMDPAIRELISAKSMGVDPSYAQGWKQAGFTDISIRDLVSAKSVGVDPSYAQGWKNAGYTDLSLSDLISAKSVGIDPSYAQNWKQAGLNDVSMRELISAKSTGINPAYAKSWQQAGFSDLSMRTLVALKSEGIDDNYFDTWKAMGYAHLTARDLVELKSSGISPTYSKEIGAAGYSHIELHDLIMFKMQGVTPEFIKGFQTLGFSDIQPHTILQMKSLGVTPEYITTMKSKGFNSSDLQEYIKLKTFKQSQ